MATEAVTRKEKDPTKETNVFSGAMRFILENKVRYILVSLLVLVPCFWHKHIEAGDLGSHVYNVWLAQLIREGRITGLYLASQFNNVLFDVLLDRTSALFGFAAAEKICVSAAVFTFFWGAFSFVSAAVRRAPWFLTPVLMMLCYGRTFSMGFMNFYISLGIAFLGLSIVWRGKIRDSLLLLVLMPLMWLAHPLGFAFFCSVAAYIVLCRVLRPKYQLVALTVSLLGIIGVTRYIAAHYQVAFVNMPFYLLNGTDQLRLFNDFYLQLSGALALAAAAFVVVEILRRKRDTDFLRGLWVPAQLYVVIWFTIFLLPNTIVFPQYSGPVAFVVTRMTLALAISFCCVLASVEVRIWHVATFGAIATLFFFSLFLDTGRMNDFERQAEVLVARVPSAQRVAATTISLPPSGWPLWHVVDRACIGRCFVYSNYEPASGQFRVRALPGNGIALASSDDVLRIQNGNYVVREKDVPLYVITPCSDSRLKVCGRFVSAGENIGLAGSAAGK